MALLIKLYPDLLGPFWHYDNTVKLWFCPSKWLYLREEGNDLKPISGVTNTLKIVDKSEALVPWAIKKVVERAYNHLVATHGRLDGFVELTTEDLMEALMLAKREPDEILVDAGEVGHNAHHYVEALIAATLKEDEKRKLEILAKFPEDDRATNCVIAALMFFVTHNVRFVSSEQRVFSRELDVAGTLDGHILMDSCDDRACGCQKAAPFKDMSVMLDMKTSNGVRETYWGQCGLYRFAKCEEFPLTKFDATVILRMGKDDAAEFEPWFAFGDEPYQRHIQFFKNALALKKSYLEVQQEMRDIRDARRAIEKEVRDKAKEIQLAIDCGKKDYKGIRRPACNGGKGCDTCKRKYAETQAAKANN